MDEDWHGLEVIQNARSETSVRYVEIGDSHDQRFVIVKWHNLGVMAFS